MATRTRNLPKWALPVGVVVLIGGAYYVYKKKKQSEEEPKATEQNPYLAQSFIPVTAENVAGVGAVSATTGPNSEEGTALLNAAEENRKSIFEFLENKERRRTEESLAASQRQGEKEGLQFERQIRLAELTNSLTGGGAPTAAAAAPVGTVVATSSPGSVAPPTSNATSDNNCPPDYPLFNPAPGRGCYRISKTRTGGGCECHGYPNGQLECQQGKASNGSCHW